MLNPVTFDPEALVLCQLAFDNACALVPEQQLTPELKASIAERVLRRAGDGERDPIRLRIYAMANYGGMSSAPLRRERSGGAPRD